jgi:DNA-binding NarL/FixJ family response regulator
VRVLLVDDDASFRRALARVIAVETDIQVVGEAHNGEAAVARALELRPDAVCREAWPRYPYAADFPRTPAVPRRSALRWTKVQ